MQIYEIRDDRQMCVRYRNFLLVSFFATSGVPQGLNLGPLLFINDLAQAICGNKLFFAGYLKLHRLID